MKYYAIIVAGGSGSRMGSEIPKQFLQVAGKPVLMHTIEAFYYSDFRPGILLVLPSGHHDYWSRLCMQAGFTVPVTLVAGGEQRFHSVKNALETITEESVIAIHDAVRPVISNKIISNTFRIAEEGGNAIVAIPSKDSIRQVNADGHSVALDRKNIFLVQTPQTFRSGILKAAYTQAFSPEFTDDASVVEKSGIAINLVEGDPDNLKITFPGDLLIAEWLLAKKNPAQAPDSIISIPG
ncbi:2-C-methyl-D-erythritol 4-phosphate cytidylyltransferase [Hufsiella ginkgonis]|uniref:2-C-methyl-D-erythritol 4-phosphate cytidylyltransferase n=1 Tax=Hufsiella ginkgonis TaxID=2695274 RepID=A0A7K1XYC8_9SPHI|nr:2-C-methyl-D-erythritol 4-phosphate cytidylyltransferase [Hufsiella ginkgonis]MXV15546.1 2-C-methyl-D-erythritol 4-phosphate cytidylyltransferase [Hufsiella ginkgonis]